MDQSQIYYSGTRAPIVVPTRAQVLAIKMHFRGGIIINSPTFGRMPWWPSALSWMNASDRQLVYEAMRAVGDTHALIEIPNGFPLYDEQGQFYSPDKFPAIDWTNNESSLNAQFTALVNEVINEGFYYIIAMDERVAHSQKIVQLVMNALTDYQLSFGCVMPGYDGVFYGWDPSAITNWAQIARAIRQQCILIMEFNTAHIPLGNGPSDYQSNGAMSGFDGLLGEFDSGAGLHSDTTWQILGRCLAGYKRPPDQPATDDPHPPFYLVDSTRGPRTFTAFETDYPYKWVRIDMTNQSAIDAAIAEIEAEKNYFASMGCPLIG